MNSPLQRRTFLEQLGIAGAGRGPSMTFELPPRSYSVAHIATS